MMTERDRQDILALQEELADLRGLAKQSAHNARLFAPQIRSIEIQLAVLRDATTRGHRGDAEWRAATVTLYCVGALVVPFVLWLCFYH